MISRRTLILAGGLVLVLATVAVWLWQQQAAAQAAAPLRQEAVRLGDIISSVSATGALAPETQVSLFFGVASPSPVAAVNVALGESVTKGDVLAYLDATDLELSVRQAEQNLQSAELALAQLTAPPRPEDLALAEANLKLARAQVYQASQGSTNEQVEIAWLNLVLARRSLEQLQQRMTDLVEQGRYGEKQALEAQEKQLIASAREADLRYRQAKNRGGSGGSALAAVEQAEVALEQLKRGPDPDEVRIAQLQVEQAQAALEQAHNALKQAQLIAPFDGVVAAVNLREGEVPSASLPAIVLADVRQYHIDVAVDEVDIARVAAGQPVTVTVDALPNDVFSGVVESIALQSTVNAGVVSYPVRVVVHSNDARLRGGMTTTADIVVQEARAVVLIPNWAVRRDRQTGKAFASVLRNGEVQEVEVTLGLRNETVSEVISGLNVGEVVAVSTQRQTFSLFGGN